MKLKKDDIQSILEKAVGSALGNTEVTAGDNSDARIAGLEKSISGVAAQVAAIAEMAANGFEKPKTAEEAIEDFTKTIPEMIEKAVAKATGKEEADEKLPETKEDLNKMIADAVTATLEKSLGKKDDPKGEGKDDLEKALDNADDDDEVDLGEDDGEDSVEKTLSAELTDAAGNELSKTQREKRQGLDDYFGKLMTQNHKEEK